MEAREKGGKREPNAEKKIRRKRLRLMMESAERGREEEREGGRVCGIGG